MEGLIQLVAASFIRHGIESPDEADALPPLAIRAAEPTHSTTLPEHNYRTSTQSDPAP
jgi:hypothetical protein